MVLTQKVSATYNIQLFKPSSESLNACFTHIYYYKTDEDPGLQIEIFAMITICGVYIGPCITVAKILGIMSSFACSPQYCTLEDIETSIHLNIENTITTHLYSVDLFFAQILFTSFESSIFM